LIVVRVGGARQCDGGCTKSYHNTVGNGLLASFIHFLFFGMMPHKPEMASSHDVDFFAG